MKIELKKISLTDDKEIYEMLKEIPADENGFINNVHNKTYSEYKEWIKKSVAASNRKDIIDGWKVPQTLYWLYIDDHPVGFGKIRHFLTEKLLIDGGNVGYAIRPSERKKGYGNIILAELLKECKELNINEILLTIKKENHASINVALSSEVKVI